ncbi:MAG: GMC family oxidoreductase [Pseudomonadota bacterium]
MRAVVVGSGAGGAAAVYALTARGVEVTLLEAGPRYDPAADYRLDREDWERTGFPEKVPTGARQTFAPMQRLDPEGSDLRSWNRIRGRKVAGDVRSPAGGYKHTVGYGGSTLYYTGEHHRLARTAFSMRSDYGVGADWPIGYDDLAPYYDQAEALVGVSGGGEDPDRPRASAYPMGPLPRSYASEALTRGFDALGWPVAPNPLAVLSEPYDDRPPCNFCGGCNRGCPRLDKGSFDLTYLRRAEATGLLTTILEAQATRLIFDDGGDVREVRYRDAMGREAAVSGDLVFLACGAVETPRLLLNSRASGLRDPHERIGKGFMETSAWTSVALHPERIGSHRGHPSDVISWRFNRPDAVDGVVGGFRLTPGTAEANLVGPINYASRVVGGFGRAHKRAMRAEFGRALAVAALGESLPDEGGLVDLDPIEVDRWGLPKARIHSRLSGNEIRRLAAMRDACRAVLTAAGAGPLIEETGTYDEFGSSHVFGGCAMGRDPRDSVVDPDGRRHGSKNLFVVDASVFPSTGGGESPALTIAANALRAVEMVFKR